MRAKPIKDKILEKIELVFSSLLVTAKIAPQNISHNLVGKR